MSWKAITGIVIATALTVWGYADIKNTASRQSETLVLHTEALAKLELGARDLSSKVDALLWQSGLNPKTVVKDANAAAAK